MERIHDETLLGSQFQEFYGEVVRLKHRIESHRWWPDEDAGAPAEDREPSAQEPEGVALPVVWQTLLTLLERQALAAHHPGGDFASEVYRQGQYMMAALADEVFLHTEWPGSESWKSNLLEAKLFGSHRAGEAVFERIETILASGDRAYRELARIHLLALGLGFQGKYRDSAGGADRLAAVRRRLYEFVHQWEPETPAAEGLLFPPTYASTVSKGSTGYLPHLRPWLLAFGLLLAGWVVGTYPLWSRLIRDLRPYVDTILSF